MIPKSLKVDKDFPRLFAEALLLAAPFYEKPFALDMSEYPHRAQVLAHILPIYKACGVSFNQQAAVISIVPGNIAIPVRPKLPVDPQLAAFLLSFPSVRAGKAKIAGFWPDWPEASAAWQSCSSLGWRKEDGYLLADCAIPIKDYVSVIPPSSSPEWLFPVQAALAVCAALMKGEASLPRAMLADADTEDFLRHAGVRIVEDGRLSAGEKYDGQAWNVPSPAWAMALAIAACCRKSSEGIPLGNPGIVTELWPQFWSFYNSLPNPRVKIAQPDTPKLEKSRRRIITKAVAVPPAITEDDWD